MQKLLALNKVQYVNIGGSRLQYTFTGRVATLGRPVPGMLTVHNQGLLVDMGLSRPAGVGLGQAKKKKKKEVFPKPG